MMGFFIFGTANCQDMFPVLFEALKSGKDCWVCFFDCFLKKRQLRKYKIEEVERFFEKTCRDLNIPQPIFSFYRPEDEIKYRKDFERLKPEIIFVQEINPRYPVWYPGVSGCKVVHFAWWDESKHLKNPKIPVDITILKQEDDIKYGYGGYKTKYFGNLRLDHLKYVKKPEDGVKRCFIPETYLRMSNHEKENSKKIIQFCDELIGFLHDNNFQVIWKKREKGFPKERWASPLDFSIEQPDDIIEKDLYFPSRLFSDAYISDCSLIVNDCFAFFDIVHMNTNSVILTSHGGRQKKIDDFFLEDYSDRIVDMKKENGWDLLRKILDKTNDFEYNETNVSKKILDYCESEL